MSTTKRRNLHGLDSAKFKKNKQWQVDQDNEVDGYVSKLKKQAKCGIPHMEKEAQEALAYLAQFNDEYYSGEIKKGDPTAIHNTDALRKDCYNRNNHTNNDVYSIYDSGNAIVKADLYEEEQFLIDNLDASDNPYGIESEDALNDYLDAKMAQERKTKTSKSNKVK